MIFQNYKQTLRLLLIGVLSIISINVLFSQRHHNKTENFENQAPKLIADLMYSFMDVIQIKTKEINKKELTEIEKQGMIDFKNRFVNVDSVKMSDMDIFLSKPDHGWSNNCYNLFKAYETNYKEQLENGGELSIILNINDNDRTVNFSNGSVIIDNQKQSILNKYNIEIKNKTTKIKDYMNTDHINDKVTQKENTQKEIEFFNWWNITLYSIILLLIALLIFIIDLRINADDKVKELENKNRKLNDKISDLVKVKSLYNQEKRLKENNDFSNRKDYQKLERNKTLNKPTHHEEYYKKNVNPYIEDNKKTDVEPIESTIERSITTNEKIIKKVPENKKKYFRFPNDNGSFNLFDGQSSPESRSFYEIEYNDNRGVLRYRGNNSDKVILQDIDKRLFPVADLVDGSNVDSPTKIEIKGNGEVVLVNNKWVVTGKIKVKLL